MKLKMQEVIKAVEGTLAQGSMDSIVKGVSTDSRSIAEGELFFALKGPNFDGHVFVRDIALKGAAGAVVESAEGLGIIPPSFNVILVKDTLLALGGLASYFRGLHKIPFVAISGSAGKTTTKEMIASILGRSRNVLKTEGNKNNLIGLPLTLFRLTPEHEAAVVELGISEIWEMERLVEMCRPDVAVITNIGRGHLKTLGSLEGVANAKGALFTRLGSHAIKIVNLDDPWAVRLAKGSENTVTYSLKEKADVRVKGCSVDEDLNAVTALYDIRGRELSVRINAPGVANVVNGAAAIAAALSLGVPLEDMKEGLSSFSTIRGRMHILRAGGLVLLDDTYNANPESMTSALRTLKAAKGRKVAVLGDMLELGEAAEAEHCGIGRMAGELGIDLIVAVGDNSGKVAEGAISAGARHVYSFREKKEALIALKGLLKHGDSVLVKGSRGVRLEEIVEGLKEAGQKKACC
ncbi:MAG: UDP-N-acetylmuramoyl-tripeptide--D-alanyl-D-alanine ligase [Deltaproteobacteria bacterium]|nr:UDP-N-acetylmuramoyl-tripeptide--D-alanyl-D-alanine ligase [Deltaproteobacteria bacterium]